jgi:hypothetical protein
MALGLNFYLFKTVLLYICMAQKSWLEHQDTRLKI